LTSVKDLFINLFYQKQTREKKMYQVTIKGRTLTELKKAVSDINEELQSGVLVGHLMEKDLAEEEEEVLPIEEAIEQACVAPAQAVAPVLNVNELDSEGLPWDARIHASSKAKVKDGTWRLKRGVDDVTAYQIKLELHALMKKSGTVVAPAAPVQAVAPAAPVQAVAPAIPATLPTINAGHTFETFKVNFPMILGTLISEGKVNQEYVEQLKKYFGVAEIWNINDEQKLQLFENFANFGFIQKA